MAERTVYIRITAKDADKAVAELRKIGVRGEKSLERIRKAARPASLGLVGLDKSVGLASRSMAGLTARIAAVAAPGAMGAVVKGAVQSADTIGKAAKAAGIGSERFQALTFAAEQSGVSAEQFADGLRRLNRRLGLFVQDGGGPAAKAFERLGLAQDIASGKLRTSEQVFDAAVRQLQGIENQAERTAVASQLFGEDAGPRLALLVNQGADGIAALEAEARKLGLVISGDLIAGAETMNDVFDQLGQTLRTNFQAGVLEGFVGSIGDLRDIVADPALREGARDLGAFVGTVVRLMVQHRAEVAAFVAALGALKVAAGATRALPLPGQLKVLIPLLAAGTAGVAAYGAANREVGTDTEFLSGSLEQLRDRLEKAESLLAEFRSLPPAELVDKFDDQLPSFDLSQEGDRLKAIKILEDRIVDLKAAIASAGSEAAPMPTLPTLGASDAKAVATAERLARANREVIASLEQEQTALGMTERQRFIDTAQRRLNAEATDAQRETVRALAGDLFDERAAQDEANRIREEGRHILEETRTPAERYQATIERLNELLDAGAISQATFARAVRQAEDDYSGAGDAARDLEEAGNSAVRAIASGFEELVIEGGKVGDVLKGLERQLLSIGTRTLVGKPFERALEGAFGGIFGGGTPATPATTSGAAGATGTAAAASGGGGWLAQAFGSLGGLFGFQHGGMVIGPGGPKDDRVPILASAGEFVMNAEATRRHRPLLEAMNAGDIAMPRFARGGIVEPMSRTTRPSKAVTAPPIVVENMFHITTPDAESFGRSRGQLEVMMGLTAERAMRRGA